MSTSWWLVPPLIYPATISGLFQTIGARARESVLPLAHTGRSLHPCEFLAASQTSGNSEAKGSCCPEEAGEG